MGLIVVATGPRQRVPGAVLYDVDDGRFAVVHATEHELLFAAGTRVERAYHVDTVKHWDDELKPSLTRLAFVARRVEVDAATFRARYLGHAAIAREQHPAICRYVQHFVRRGTDPVCAAVAELHFVDSESMRTGFYRDERSAAVVAADIDDYLDRDRTWSLLTRPRI